MSSDDRQSVINLADLNARSVNDETLNLWLGHEYGEVRTIAIEELRRRNLARSEAAERHRKEAKTK